MESNCWLGCGICQTRDIASSFVCTLESAPILIIIIIFLIYYLIYYIVYYRYCLQFGLHPLVPNPHVHPLVCPSAPTLIIIIKLLKVWESGVIKGKILAHLKALCRHRRTLEEAARFKLFIKLEMNMRNSTRWAVLKKFSVTFPFMLTIL